jgi:microsomal dipeptidase-like Zn-dependent dipeptidase
MFPLRIMALLSALVPVASAQVDLHAHLVMKPGMGPGLIGDFESPPRSPDWTSRIRTKASRTSLLNPKSPEVIVVSLYGHPWLSRMHLPGRESNVSEALEEEYRQIKAFVDAPGSIWTLARSPREARSALKSGKKVLILSIEGAYGAIRTPADLDRWVDRGLAILTPFHLTEDRFGGVALMKPWAALFNTPVSLFFAWLNHRGTCPGGICRSPVGISELGLELIGALIQKQVWIDFSHANDLTVERLIPLLRERNLPILVTHTASRDSFPAERGLSETLIREIRGKSDGIVGLIPSEEMIRVESAENGCRSGVSTFRKAFDSLRAELGEHRVALGSDANAPLQGLSPPCDAPSEPGYAEYAHIPSLVRYEPKVLEHFLTLWQRVRPDPSGVAPTADSKSLQTQGGIRR